MKEAEHADDETSGLVRTAACSPASRTGGSGERQADRNQSCCWAKTPDACSRFHAAKASFIPRGSFLDKKLIKVCVSVGGGAFHKQRSHQKVIIGSFHWLRGTNCKRITDRHVECNQPRSSDPGTSSMSVLLSHTHTHTCVQTHSQPKRVSWRLRGTIRESLSTDIFL